MKRAQQQVIDDAGERQMRGIFEPLGWAVRAVHKDNGIDFDMNLAVGTRLGPYEIIAPVGACGLGEVYLAQDSRLKCAVVAFKGEDE